MFTSNFTKPLCQNLGSIRDFLFIPEANVTDMDINELENILYTFTLAGGAAWLKGYSTIDKKIVDQAADETDNGTVFRPVFTGFFPGYNFWIEKIFTHMSNGRFILDITDYNNQRIVLGRIGNGMNFSWKHSTGGSSRSLQGYSFRFYQDSPYPKLRYSPGVALTVPDVL